MNRILFQTLSQNPSMVSRICLRFRWILPFLPYLGFFLFPLLGTWLGHIFIDLDDLYAQVFSLDGLIYLGMLMRMIPKPERSSKRERDAHLLTAQCNGFYFLELMFFAYIGFVVSYEVSWLMSISFSTVCTLVFYAILLGLGISSLAYFKTILNIYIFGNLGVIFALGLFSPYYIYKFLLLIALVYLINHLLHYKYPMILLRCIFWGILSVWIDYWGCSLFYILEMVFAKDNNNKENPLSNVLPASSHRSLR